MSKVPLWRRIFKTERGSFNYIDTLNVDFIDSALSDEKKPHITSSNDDSWKYDIQNNSVIFQYSTFWVINLPRRIVIYKASRDIISLSVTNPNGVFNLDHL